MKQWMIAVLVSAMALPAFAWLGQPVAEDATTEMSEARVTGALTLESDVKLYGARFTYGLLDGMALFGGLGVIDADGFDSDIYFQLGGQYRLPVQLPFDLALRGSFGMTSIENDTRGAEMDIWTLGLGALGSHPINNELTVYGYAGISIQNVDGTEMQRGSFVGPDGERWVAWRRQSIDDTDVEPALAAGALYHLGRNISFFGEISHIDDLFVSLGVRYDLW